MTATSKKVALTLYVESKVAFFIKIPLQDGDTEGLAISHISGEIGGQAYNLLLSTKFSQYINHFMGVIDLAIAGWYPEHHFMPGAGRIIGERGDLNNVRVLNRLCNHDLFIFSFY